MMNNKSEIRNQKSEIGFSLVEIIIAVAIFGLFATALIGLIMNSYGSNFQAKERDIAVLYAEEGMEAVWSIRRQAWNLLANGDHGLANPSKYWEFSGTTELIDDKFTRVITIEDACRDGSGDLADCPATTIDLNSKKIIVTVTYTAITYVVNTVELINYLTTWQSRDWTQIDWVGGAGRTIWSDTIRYESDDGNVDVISVAGQVTLAPVSGNGCGVITWPFTTAGNYTYVPADIEVTGGEAQLVSSGIPGSSGGTTNPDFDTDDSGWTYNDWDQGGGEVNVTGSHSASGGNPNGYVDIDVPKGGNDEVGGYWEQSFVVTGSSPTATLDFDWSVFAHENGSNTFQLYVFVDTATGAPTLGTEAWASGEISGTTGWASVPTIDVSSFIPSAGTYYLKIATWVETPKKKKGPFNVGYDNVQLDWATSGSSSYPTTKPPINPNASVEVNAIDEWSSFSEEATKNGGEIYYQLSEDDGSTWQYWDGGNWVTAASTEYNVATDVNSNISTFSTTNKKIMFKAFLESDGTQQVLLDEVRISCAQNFNWPFTTSGNYVFNIADIVVTGGEAQLVGPITGNNIWLFTTAGNYTYVLADIEVIGGVAQLVSSDGGGDSGNTNNPDFDTDASGWTYNDWDQSGGEVNVTGTIQSSGGNPNGYIDVNFPGDSRKDELGGYWEQSFVTTGAADTATVDFDWIVNQFDANSNTFILYVFVDSATGEPTVGQQVWSSGEITGATSWASVSSLNVASSLTSAGTFYLKVAVWMESPNSNAGPLNIGYDNVQMDWSTSGSSSYPTDEPPINPNTSYTQASANFWTGFTEDATKDGGEIYYQLSDDDGSNWQYWDGGNWTGVVGATDYNTATVVNTNISNFSATAQKIMFKAFLESDGTQLVKLSEILIDWSSSLSGFPTNAPPIYPNSFASPSEVWEWTVFTETATKNGGEIYYQLSEDEGSTWQYWNGSLWATASTCGSGGGDCNTATDINANILDYTTSTNKLNFRAFLDSDGTQQVLLDNVKISWGEEGGGGGGFEAAGWLVSSAFDTGTSSSFNIVVWNDDIPVCTPICTIQLQVRTALDSGGSPGTWTSWYGASGANTYFTDKTGTLIPAGLNFKQWMQYRVELAGDDDNTPIFQDVTINYTP